MSKYFSFDESGPGSFIHYPDTSSMQQETFPFWNVKVLTPSRVVFFNVECNKSTSKYSHRVMIWKQLRNKYAVFCPCMIEVTVRLTNLKYSHYQHGLSFGAKSGNSGLRSPFSQYVTMDPLP